MLGRWVTVAGGNANILAIARSCLLLAWLTAIGVANSCDRDTLDIVNGTPVGNHRTCSVSLGRRYCNCEGSTCHELASEFCPGESLQCYPLECPGFVGMNLTYECSFEGARLYKHQDGKYQYLNGSSVNYGLLLPEHAGLYECRNSINHVVHAQNLTVNQEVRIGSIDDDCRHYPEVDKENKCCSSTNEPWSVSDRNSKYQFAVYSNPDEYLNVTVEQIKWLVDEETRNDVDVGFYRKRSDIDPVVWLLGFRNVPEKVTKETPQVMFRISATNANSTYSLCSIAHFDLYTTKSEEFQIKNTSHPENASIPEGQEATFKCEFSYTKSVSTDFYAIFEFSRPVQKTNRTTLEVCTMKYTFYIGLEYNQTIGNCSLPPLARFERSTSIASNSVAGVTTLTFRIPSISANLSGSSATCSLYGYSSNLLQWRRVAHLKVLTALVTTDPTTSLAGSVSIVGTLVSVLIVITATLSLGVGTAVVLLKRRKNSRRMLRIEEVLLTKDTLHSSGSHLCGSEASTPVSQTSHVPGIEIMGSNGAQRNGLLVGEQLPNGNTQTDSFDPRVSLDFQHQSPQPIGLQLLRDSQRALELYDLSEFEEFVVYISYTDQMSVWVRNELKPLIESWHSVFRVNIHEDSMIPGFSVSGERHRLIFEADKIVIVVSSDYATSEWCVYELEHAIHQMPALCNGRVIPILTDSSNSLPRIISGVVSLNSTHTDFNTRLHQAILKKPNFMV